MLHLESSGGISEYAVFYVQINLWQEQGIQPISFYCRPIVYSAEATLKQQVFLTAYMFVFESWSLLFVLMRCYSVEFSGYHYPINMNSLDHSISVHQKIYRLLQI